MVKIPWATQAVHKNSYIFLILALTAIPRKFVSQLRNFSELKFFEFRQCGPQIFLQEGKNDENKT